MNLSPFWWAIAAEFAALSLVFYPKKATAQVKTWNVGVVCPLTTSSRSFGIGHLQGVTLAYERFKNETKLPVELEIVDDQADPDLGKQAVQRLFDRGAVAVLGPCNSSVATAVLAQPGLTIPIVASLTTATKLTEDSTKHPYFFRANVSDAKRMEALLYGVFNAFRPGNIVILYEDGDSYGMGMLNDANTWLQQNQKQFVQSAHVKTVSYRRDLGVTGAAALVETLRTSYGNQDDVWLLLGLASDGRSIVTAVRQKEIPVQMYLPGPEPELFQSLAREGVDVADVRFISVWDETDQTIDRATIQFKTSFSLKFNGHPPSEQSDDGATYDAALGYDGARVLFSAAQNVLSDPAAGTLSIQEIRDRLRRELLDYRPKPTDHVLSGDEHFKNGEYADLKFFGLKFDHKGRSLRWEQPVPPAENPIIKDAIPVVLPHGMVLLLVGAAGLLGSVTRKIYSAPEGMDNRASLRYLVRPEVFAADPLISVIVFVTLYLAVLLFYPKFNSSITGQALYYAAGVVGFMAGYLGVRALHVVLEKLGVSGTSLKESPKDTPAAPA